MALGIILASENSSLALSPQYSTVYTVRKVFYLPTAFGIILANENPTPALSPPKDMINRSYIKHIEILQ